MSADVEVMDVDLSRALADRLLRTVDEEVVTRGIRKLAVAASAGAGESGGVIGSPTVATAADSPNSRHAAALVLRTARLQSVANWMQSLAAARLAKLEAELVSELRAKDPTTTVTAAGARVGVLDKLFQAAGKRVANAFGSMAAQAEANFTKLAEILHAEARAALKEHHGLEPAGSGSAATTELPVLGAPLSEHFQKMAGDALFRFKAAVRTGLQAGDTLEQLVARVAGGQGGAVAASGGNEQGHPFWGNQWTEGGGEVEVVSDKARLKRMTIDEVSRLMKQRGFLFKKSDTAPNNKGEWKTLHYFEDQSGREHVMDKEEIHRRLAVKATESVRADAKADLVEAARKRLEVRVRLMDASENSVSKVIEAAIQEFSNEADLQAAGGGEAKDGGEAKAIGWQWVAVMDANTCPQCEFYDGSRWTADYEPVGDAPAFPDEPPLHYGCRCSLVPSDTAAEAAPDMDFDEYLSQFSRSEQEAAFGKENLRAYHRGDITAAGLIGQRSNLMTLEQFKGED